MAVVINFTTYLSTTFYLSKAEEYYGKTTIRRYSG